MVIQLVCASLVAQGAVPGGMLRAVATWDDPIVHCRRNNYLFIVGRYTIQTRLVEDK